VRRIVVVSIIGIDRFSAGYDAAKLAHEKAMLAGPIPVRIVRAAQFHSSYRSSSNGEPGTSTSGVPC
jgi:hypothetical protein